MNSGPLIENTPVTQNPKKRELTSPEFDTEYKKNKTASETSGTSVTRTSGTAGTMASDPVEVMDTHGIPPAGPTITIPPSEMLKLSELLKGAFRTEIVSLVNNIAKGVLKGLKERITSLESNKDLQDTNKSLAARVAVLESQADQAEQYSRRNCLRISGVTETPGENTDSIVLSVTNDIESDIRLQDIDRSHRIDNPKKKRSYREIIVKFSTYRACAHFYKQRTLMKEEAMNENS